MSLQASCVVTPGIPGRCPAWSGAWTWTGSDALLVPSQAPPPLAKPGHAPLLSTHHADLGRHEVAQSVEPFHVSLQVVSLVTETWLGKTQGPYSVFLSITSGTWSQFIDHH